MDGSVKTFQLENLKRYAILYARQLKLIINSKRFFCFFIILFLFLFFRFCFVLEQNTSS